MWEIAIFCALLGEADELQGEGRPTNVCREVEDMALHYRLRVYDTFRTERPVYDTWAARGFEVLEFSRLLPTESPQQRELVDWFQRATEASLDDLPLPEPPQIDWTATAGPSWAGPPQPTVPVSRSASEPPRPRSRSSLPWGAAAASFSNTDQASPATPGDATPDDDAQNRTDARQEPLPTPQELAPAGEPDGA